MNFELNTNSVWQFKDVDGFAAGVWRLITICPVTRLAIVIQIVDDRSVTRPKPLSQKYFSNLIQAGAIVPLQYNLPPHQLRTEADISDRERACRDERYQLIAPAISDSILPVKLALNARVADIVQYAQEAGTSRLRLSQLLCLYWKYGQQKNALLPAFCKRGAPGKIREPGEKKRGRPRRYSTQAFDAAVGVNMDGDIRKAFLKAMKRYYLKEKPTTIIEIRKEFNEKHFGDELERAKIMGEEPNVPSEGQFYYWKKVLIDPAIEICSQNSRREWLLNKRALLSSASINSPLPGCCFEIDATIADPHLVSELNRNHCIGRATVYAVVDRASHMIVGLYVGLESESWAAARQALFNCILPKKDYCARFNVLISESDWPCHHMAMSLVSDRGGLLSKQPQTVVPRNMNLEFTATDRADMKSIVESRFGIFKADVFDKTEGTTLGKPIKRRQKDPRDEARYTMREFTEILIHEVLEHNNYKQFADLALNPLLIEADLAPTPRNFWNVHREKYAHALRDVCEADARALFLEPVTAAVTRHGFEYKGLLFSSDRAEEEGWFVDARSNGRWKVEARVNLDDTSQFFVRKQASDPFEKCRMLPKTKLLEGSSMADVIYLREWKTHKGRQHEFSPDGALRRERREELRLEARRAQEVAPPNKTKKEKRSNIRERRAAEKEYLKEQEEVPEVKASESNVSHFPKTPRSKDMELISLIHALAEKGGKHEG